MPLLFDRILNEQDDLPPRVVVLASYSTDDWTCSKVRSWCDANKAEFVPLHNNLVKFDDFLPAVNNDVIAIFVNDLEQAFALEKQKVYCLNPYKALSISHNAYLTFKTLRDGGVWVPNFALNNQAAINLNYPIKLLTLDGENSVICESQNSFTSLMLFFSKLHKKFICIESLRGLHAMAYVLGDQFLGAINKDGDKIEIQAYEEENCILAAKVLGLPFVELEIAIFDDAFFIVGVNSNPQILTLEQAARLDVISQVLSYAFNYKNHPKEICGYSEAIYIDGIGNVAARFDTGNSSANALHAEDVIIDRENRTAAWTSNNLHMIRPCKKILKLKGTDEARPIVQLDVSFNGHKFREIEFILEDRTGKSNPIVLSRDLVTEFNVAVDPGSQFVLTSDPFALTV